MSARPWLIGELNPFGGDPDMALYPLPENSSGGRLARTLGLSRTDYLRAFERRNLCTEKWRLSLARCAAGQFLAEANGAPIVLLGAKVCAAFAVPFAPFTGYVDERAPAHPLVVVLPHPSGLNRMWNQPGAQDRARALVLPLLKEIT